MTIPAMPKMVEIPMISSAVSAPQVRRQISERCKAAIDGLVESRGYVIAQFVF